MTTNYVNTFITVAPDCPVDAPAIPPASAAKPSVAAMQYELLSERPYELTSDELLFTVHAIRAGIADAELNEERTRFLAKSQACLRASPLGKRYGWGTHHDEQGRVAVYGVGTPEYERLSGSPDLAHTAAMRSSRA
ncbi:DUF6157 family protein [Planctomonas psychrotolerans]|uniref:DUF6157 family protein n=1 Tax=Planctomonas psychrotolerans TaxID=2528712 RepID=UPI0012389FD6|nr:DUF6157 family protein [Planctomonas psychrotolerans]